MTILESFTLSWRQLSVFIDEPLYSWRPKIIRQRKRRIILDNVSGSAEAGRIVAVVGPSGSGKTTLLAAITRNLPESRVSGEVLLNGQPTNRRLLGQICGFVPQHHIATETLTVREHLSFMAALLLDSRISDSDKLKRIRTLITDLGLDSSADTRLQLLSGGERRRLAVADQLVGSPLILIADEPCSGLDSEASTLVLNALRKEANTGRVILCSMHQVPGHVLHSLDEVLVLAQGKVLFHGLTEEAYPFFKGVGLELPSALSPPVKLQKVLHMLCDPDCHINTDAISSRHLNRPYSEEVLSQGFLQTPDVLQTSCWTEIRWLLWRGILDTRRKFPRHVVQIAVVTMTCLLLTTCFSKVNSNTMPGVQSMRGLLFLICSEIIFTTSYCVFNAFPSELPIFLRENQVYSPSTFYVSKVLLITPRAVLEPIFYVIIIHCQMDLTAAAGLSSLLMLLVIIVAASLASSAYGCMLSAQFESPEMVYLTTMPIDFMNLLVAGIFHSIGSLSTYFGWLRFLSPFYYSYEATSVIYWRNVKKIDCSGAPCLSDGAAVLDDLGFSENNVWRNIAGLLLLCVGFHLIGYLGVWRRSRQRAAY